MRNLDEHSHLLTLVELTVPVHLYRIAPRAAIWLIVEELLSRIGAGNRDVREVFAVQGAVAVLPAGWREDDVALCALVS